MCNNLPPLNFKGESMTTTIDCSNPRGIVITYKNPFVGYLYNIKPSDTIVEVISTIPLVSTLFLVFKERQYFFEYKIIKEKLGLTNVRALEKTMINLLEIARIMSTYAQFQASIVAIAAILLGYSSVTLFGSVVVIASFAHLYYIVSGILDRVKEHCKSERILQ